MPCLPAARFCWCISAGCNAMQTVTPRLVAGGATTGHMHPCLHTCQHASKQRKQPEFRHAAGCECTYGTLRLLSSQSCSQACGLHVTPCCSDRLGTSGNAGIGCSQSKWDDAAASVHLQPVKLCQNKDAVNHSMVRLACCDSLY